MVPLSVVCGIAHFGQSFHQPRLSLSGCDWLNRVDPELAGG
jgi:hypothetical protein